MTKLWPSKDPEEIITVTFDFTDDLNGAAITGGSAVTSVSVAEGADQDYAQTKNGAEEIQGAKVLQSVKLGLNGVNYRWQGKINTSDGRTLVLAAILPVREA